MAKFSKKYHAALFFTTLLGVLSATVCIFLAGHTLIWDGDEFYQGFNKLVYFGDTVRSAFASLFSGKGFDLPAYSLAEGYGVDNISLLGSFGNVFDWPSVLCPSRFLEAYYVAMIFIKIGLAALAFSYYCQQRGHGASESFIASLCYAMSGFVVYLAALRHPIFLTVAVFFPLVLAGVDRVFRGGRPWLFVVAMAAQLLASVYFSYMVCLAMLVYCVLKYCFDDRERSVADFFKLVAKLAGSLLLAFFIAAIIAYPAVLSLITQERLKLGRYKPLFFEPVYYLEIIPNLLGATSQGNTRGLFFSATGIVLLETFLLCGKRIDRRKRISWTVGCILVLACACLPFLSRALNGFSYATDRWMFIASFCWSYCACLVVPVLREMSRKEWARVFACSACLIVACAACFMLSGKISSRMIAMVTVFALVNLVVAFGGKKLSRRLMTGAFSLAVIVCVGVLSMFYCTTLGSNYASNFLQRGTAISTIFSKSYPAAIDRVDDNSLFRYAATKIYGMRNAALNHGTNAVDFYNSKYNQSVENLRKELGLSDDRFSFRFFGSTSRLAIDLLTGTKYYVSAKSGEWLIPYGYEKTGYKKNNLQVWETSGSIPIAFATSKVVSRSAYDELGMVGKQEALLQGCVVEDDLAVNYDSVDVSTESVDVPFSITSSKGILVDEEGSTFTVLEPNAELVIEFDGREKSETYLQIENLQFSYIYPSALAALKGKDASGYGVKDLMASQPTKYGIEVSSDGKSKSYTFGTNRDPQYGGRHNWVINTGYSEGAKHKITVSFDTTGEYSFDGMSVICQPVEHLADRAVDLAAGAADDVSFDGSSIRASYSVTEEKSLAVVTVPYSSGWSAFVDGEEVEIQRADTAFMAVELNGSGRHDVELRYSSPGFLTGAVLSLIGIVVLIALLLVTRRRRVAIDERDGD